ncbi:class I SAM-dependent methyltransferase [Spirosoma pomorum]
MNPSFEYKEIDQQGLDTLTVIEKADRFNEWMYDTIKPYCKGNVFEVGSGTGNISQFFFRDKFTITLSDIRSIYCDRLQTKFAQQPTLGGVVSMDLTDPEFDTVFADHLQAHDTVFALNVVEHIKDDALAIRNCYKLLKPGGHLIILVPAYQALYNRFDTELEHYRRYTKATLNPLFLQNNFEIIKSQHFNLMGIAGWFVSGKLQKNETIPGGQMELYNKLVPIFKLLDKLTLNTIGLSVITVGRKK